MGMGRRLLVPLGAVLVFAVTACDSKPAQTPPAVEKSGTASAATPSSPPGPEEIVRQGDLVDAGVLADGSLMTVWCSSDESHECDAFAFRATAPGGASTYGRLPGYGWSRLVAAGDRFLVDLGTRRHAFLLVDRRGRIQNVNSSSAERAITPGDVLIPPKYTDDEWAIIVRPTDGTAFKVRTPGTVRLYLAADGTLWGESAGYGQDLQVRWRREGSSFMSYTFDHIDDYEPTYGPHPGEVVASGPHAAVFSCGEAASGQGCGNKLAVTSDWGRSWVVRDFDSLPFKSPSFQGSLAVAGTTLIVAEQRWGGSKPRTVLWRSTDRTWTTFDKLASLPGTYAELKTSRAAVWTYRVPSDSDPDREAFGPLLRIDLNGTVHQVVS